MRNSWMKCAFLMIVVCAAVCCETVVGPYGSPLEAPVVVPGGVGPAVPSGDTFSLITGQQEIELGQQIAAEVEQRERVHPDAQLQAYLQTIGERISAESPRQDVPYRFTVIDDPDTINAFALPGGHLYAYTGLMKVASNEAELAAVLAHEISHVALRHHAATITRQYGFEMLTSIILGQKPDELSQLVAGLIGQGVEARYSRDQERAADALGMQLLVQAGYSPEAMLSFYQKMYEASGRTPNLPLFASHPPTQERLQSLQALLNTFPAATRTNPVYDDRYRSEVLSKI